MFNDWCSNVGYGDRFLNHSLYFSDPVSGYLPDPCLYILQTHIYISSRPISIRSVADLRPPQAAEFSELPLKGKRQPSMGYLPDSSLYIKHDQLIEVGRLLPRVFLVCHGGACAPAQTG